MSLKFKAFIYRFSNIFGLRIYLAKKEERQYLSRLVFSSYFEKGLHVGLWQAEHGFTTLYPYGPFYKIFILKVKHAFDFRSY